MSNLLCCFGGWVNILKCMPYCRGILGWTVHFDCCMPRQPAPVSCDGRTLMLGDHTVVSPLKPLSYQAWQRCGMPYRSHLVSIPTLQASHTPATPQHLSRPTKWVSAVAPIPSPLSRLGMHGLSATHLRMTQWLIIPRTNYMQCSLCQTAARTWRVISLGTLTRPGA